MKNFIIKSLASGLGLGYAPVASGTFGSLWGLLFFYLLRDTSRINYVLITIAVSIFAIYVSGEAEKIFKTKDSGLIVIDEVAGQMVSFLFVAYSFKILVIGFVLFRFFDVVKIFPARSAQDHLPGGWGVTCDDLVAGLQAVAVLFLIRYVI